MRRLYCLKIVVFFESYFRLIGGNNKFLVSNYCKGT